MLGVRKARDGYGFVFGPQHLKWRELEDNDKLEKAMSSDNPEDMARVAKEADMELSNE